MTSVKLTYQKERIGYAPIGCVYFITKAQIAWLFA